MYVLVGTVSTGGVDTAILNTNHLPSSFPEREMSNVSDIKNMQTLTVRRRPRPACFQWTPNIKGATAVSSGVHGVAGRRLLAPLAIIWVEDDGALLEMASLLSHDVE